MSGSDRNVYFPVITWLRYYEIGLFAKIDDDITGFWGLRFPYVSQLLFLLSLQKNRRKMFFSTKWKYFYAFEVFRFSFYKPRIDTSLWRSWDVAFQTLPSFVSWFIFCLLRNSSYEFIYSGLVKEFYLMRLIQKTFIYSIETNPQILYRWIGIIS